LTGNLSGRLTLLVVAGITAGGLVAWLLILVVLWLLLRALGITADFWVMTEALSTATAVAAVLVAGYIAYRELVEVANTRHMEVADRLFEELNARENVEARRWVYERLPDDPEKGTRDLTPEGRDAVKLVLNSLDRIAFLTQAGWIPDEMVMHWMSSMVVKAWGKLGPYVEFESGRRREPDYYANVVSLTEKCAAWRAANLPAAEIRWVKDSL